MIISSYCTGDLLSCRCPASRSMTMRGLRISLRPPLPHPCTNPVVSAPTWSDLVLWTSRGVPSRVENDHQRAPMPGQCPTRAMASVDDYYVVCTLFVHRCWHRTMHWVLWASITNDSTHGQRRETIRHICA